VVYTGFLVVGLGLFGVMSVKPWLKKRFPVNGNGNGNGNGKGKNALKGKNAGQSPA